MIVSDAAGLLFVHVQKTGGVTVERWLQEVAPDARRVPGCDRHAGLRVILAAEPALSGHLVLGIVRNPWSRLLSWHRMVRRWVSWVPEGQSLETLANFRGNAFAQRVARELPDFEDFVMRGTAEIPRLRRPQLSYLEAPGRRADVVGRQETLDADLRAVAARCGLPARTGERWNADDEQVDYRVAYTPAMRDRVGEIFARDVAAFGYEF